MLLFSVRLRGLPEGFFEPADGLLAFPGEGEEQVVGVEPVFVHVHPGMDAGLPHAVGTVRFFTRRFAYTDVVKRDL